MIKALFLDIDGVLNKCGPRSIEPECVAQLNRVIEATDCKLVLSSSWRQAIYFGIVTLRGFSWMFQSHDLHANLYSHIGIEDPFKLRGELIQEWLLEHPEVESYVVVDDYPEDIFEGLCQVRTERKEGLTAEKADEIIRRLGRKTWET